MRIIWDSNFKQFEAQLSSGEYWASDQQAVKAAGFKTEGPPDWKWLTHRARPLTILRDSKPQSGLTITSEALQNYNRLKAAEDANLAVKAALKAHRKELGKVEDPTKGFKMVMGPEGFLIAEVEPGDTEITNFPPLTPPSKCSVCQATVYSFERQEPTPLCLDCEFDSGL